jgi:phage tail-like protein
MSTIKNAVLWGLVLAGLLAGGSASATNFAVLLSGSSGQPPTEVDCLKLKMEDIDLAGLDSEGVTADGFRHKRPGPTRFSHIVLKRGVTRSIPDGLDVWWQEVLSGKNTSRDIKVAIFSDSGDQGETGHYSFLDCFAKERRVYEEVGADGKVIAVEEFTFASNGFSMQKRGSGASVGKPPLGRISMVDEDGKQTTDDTVEGWSGGEPALILTGPFRNSRFHTTAPGDKLVTAITLALPVGQPSQAICDWVNAAVQGKPWKKTLSITELRPNGKPGKTFTYNECFPTRYTFPEFVKGSPPFGTEGLVIEVTNLSF